MRNSFLIILIFLSSISIYGQNYILENEQVLLEFKTQKNKRLLIAKDKSDKYLIYRYGTKDKIEFEYPIDKSNSWKKFKFSSYLRGGGKANEGMDLNYLYFQVDNYKYVIYEEYIAKTEQTNYGIKVIDLKSEKIINIKADKNSIKGTLFIFRDNEKVEKGDELFM